MSETPQPIEPTPERFGLTVARINYIRGVLEDDLGQIAPFAIPIIAVCLIVANVLLPSSFGLWRFSLPLLPAVYIISFFQHRRKTAITKKRDYGSYRSFQNAMQAFDAAMKTYRYLQRQERYAACRRRRLQASLSKQQERAKWTGIDGRDFEIEVVKILFSKGYQVQHTGGTRNGDEGIDFVLTLGTKKIIGQCKAFRNYLSAGPVRDLYGTLIHQKADEAWLVGTSGFYSGAKSFAHGKPIRLLSIHDLIRLPDADAFSKRQSA